MGLYNDLDDLGHPYFRKAPLLEGVATLSQCHATWLSNLATVSAATSHGPCSLQVIVSQ